jgi:hypothetical protein
MKTRIAACAALLVLASSAFAQDVLVVTPKEFDASLAAWKAYREKQGLAVAVREPGDDVGATVRDTYAKSGKKLRFVVLVGDVDKVPCAHVTRTATGLIDGVSPDPDIATDATYADVDGDGLPDLAVGRVPADTGEEARAYLDRAVAYETDTDFGVWRRKLDVVAGAGGFGPMVDMALEKLSNDLLSRVTPSVDVTMTYANPFSPYCPPPAEFADYAVRRWNEGALVVAYVGHGSTRNVDWCRVGKTLYPILGIEQVKHVAAEHGAPISIFVACWTGQMDGDKGCLAEEMLKRPKGPIAVIASSRVSSPYSNGVLAKEMLDALYVGDAPTVGELLTEMKRRILDAAPGDEMREHLEKLAAAMYEKEPEKRRQDRADHLNLYNLFGDPCVRIARPARMTVAAPATAVPGTSLTVTGHADFDGTAIVELVRRHEPPPKAPPGGKKTAEEFRAVYDAANSHGVAKTEVAVKKGDFTAAIAVPADAAPGQAAVRVYLTGKAASAAGGAELTIGAADGSK